MDMKAVVATQHPSASINTHEQSGIVETQLYTSGETAHFLGYRSARGAKTIGMISREELPVVWVGPNGGVKRYLGSDILAYIKKRRKAA